MDASYSQPVLQKPHPIKASASSFDLVMPESSLPKVVSVSSDDGTTSFSAVTAAFRPFRSQLPATSGEMVSRLLSPIMLPSPSGCQSLQSPPIVPRLSTAAMTSQNNVEAKSSSLLSSSNGISTISTPLVASLMLHPSVSSFQLVPAIPAAHLATGTSRAPAPSVQYVVPPLALSDTGSKLMQMVQTGVQATTQSGTQQLAGFQLAALPRAAIQLGGGPQVLMLCQQPQAQHTHHQQQQQQQQQQQLLQNSPLSSVVPVMVAAGASQPLAVSK